MCHEEGVTPIPDVFAFLGLPFPESGDTPTSEGDIRTSAFEVGQPAGSVGSFRDSATGDKVHVIPKKGETPTHAIVRVRSRH